MRKVMLVIDEIQPLVGLERFLRRLGFDVLSLSKDALVNDALLGFQPDVVVASRGGRNVDGLKLSQRLKKTMIPPPRIAICYTGTPPTLSKEEQKSIDALIEIPAAGENAIRIVAQLAGLKIEPLLEKYRKFSNAKLSQDEEIVIIAGSPGQSAEASEVSSTPWDPVKNAGQAAQIRTSRSTGYDQFLENHEVDLGSDATEKVLPRARAMQLMDKLKNDAKSEKEALDDIQAEKIKFAEALFELEQKKKR